MLFVEKASSEISFGYKSLLFYGQAWHKTVLEEYCEDWVCTEFLIQHDDQFVSNYPW